MNNFYYAFGHFQSENELAMFETSFILNSV